MELSAQGYAYYGYMLSVGTYLRMLQLSAPGIVRSVSTMFSKTKKTEYNDIVKRLYELGHSTDKLANTILALMVVSGVELSLGKTSSTFIFLTNQ